MNILFLDQSGELGGAELCLLDILRDCPLESRVALLSSGPFQVRLEQANLKYCLLRDRAPCRSDRAFFSHRLRELMSLSRSLGELLHLAQESDLIYANTSKAMVLGAITHVITRRPLVYHLHDCLSAEHFGWLNRTLLVQLANHYAAQVITNSYATQQAFVAAGGDRSKTTVIYNGFMPERFRIDPATTAATRRSLGQDNREAFIVGCFSRFSPWKGQHLLLEAVADLDDPTVHLLLVGDALFGEEDYVLALRQQVQRLGLARQVHFLGFRQDVPQLLSCCDLLVHTPIAPEPFGRVIVEAMLAAKPVIAPAEGSGPELLHHGKTGWLVEPRSQLALTGAIQHLKADSELRQRLGQAASEVAQQRFHLQRTNRSVYELLQKTLRLDSVSLLQTELP